MLLEMMAKKFHISKREGGWILRMQSEIFLIQCQMQEVPHLTSLKF